MRSLTGAHSPTLFRIKPPTKIKEIPHWRRALGSPPKRPLRRPEPQQILAKSSVLPSSTLTFGRRWRRIAEIVAKSQYKGALTAFQVSAPITLLHLSTSTCLN